jgi:hypothetical protein
MLLTLLIVSAQLTHIYSVGSSQSTEIFFSPSNVLVKENQNFTVLISLINCPPFVNFWIEISYNNTVLDALSANVTVPWENRSVNIDETSGMIDISAYDYEQPLEGNQTLAMVRFEAMIKSNSTLQLSWTEIIDSGFNMIPHTARNGSVEIVGPLNITVASIQKSYYLEQNVTLCGNLTVEATPVDSIVGIEVRSPENVLITTRTVFPSSVPPDSSWPVKILNFYSSDQQGNAQSSFTAGCQAYFTITVQNLESESIPILIVINAFDRYNTPFGFTITEGTIFPASTIMFIGPILIREEAFNGTATAYANAFSNWPKNQGIPYCPEKSATFQINDGIIGPPSPALPTNLTFEAQYNVTFRIPLYAGAGNFTVYATSHYKVQDAYAESKFSAALAGDFDGDGKVLIHDFVLFAIAYGSTPEDPEWLPEADFDNNQKIAIYDFVIFAINYGKHV